MQTGGCDHALRIGPARQRLLQHLAMAAIGDIDVSVPIHRNSINVARVIRWKRYDRALAIAAARERLLQYSVIDSIGDIHVAASIYCHPVGLIQSACCTHARSAEVRRLPRSEGAEDDAERHHQTHPRCPLRKPSAPPRIHPGSNRKQRCQKRSQSETATVIASVRHNKQTLILLCNFIGILLAKQASTWT